MRMRCHPRCGAGFSVLVAASLTYAADFYVSPSGSDANAGTIAQPFATITKAQEAVRTAKAGGGDVNVYLRGGTYAISSPLTFTQADGGTGAQKITYQAYQSECVAISGGRQITGWTKGSGNLWTVDIPDVKSGAWYFRELFVNDKRMPRGRFPNGSVLIEVDSTDWAGDDGPAWSGRDTFFSLKTDKGVISEDLAGKDVEMVALHQWNISRQLVKWNKGNIVVTVNSLGLPDHSYSGTHGRANPSYNNDYGCGVYLENALSFVDQPGEWCLDRASGRLTYMAAANEDPNTESCIAPASERLLVVKGSAGNHVKGLHFVGIMFQHSKWTFPKIGYSCLQAGRYGTMGFGTPTYAVPLALEFRYAEGCSVEKCRIAHIGQTGVGFGEECVNNRVVGCEIIDAAGSGCDIGQRDSANQRFWSLDWPNASMVPDGNEISNCYVHACAAVFFDCIGIQTQFTTRTRISHNVITDLPYTGISFGFKWGDVASSLTSMKNDTIQYNHVYNVVKLLSDGGGSYSLGNQPGTLLRGNHIHDITDNPEPLMRQYAAPNGGIYFDQGSAYLCESNVIYNCSQPWQLAPNQGVTQVNNKVGSAVTQADKDAASKSAGLESAYSYLLAANAWNMCNFTAVSQSPTPTRVIGPRAIAQGTGSMAVYTPCGRKLLSSAGSIRTAGVYIVRAERGDVSSLARMVKMGQP